jgi:hypothetical protein
VAQGHSWTKDGPDAPQNFQVGAWMPFKDLFGRCTTLKALKHCFQSQSRADEHRFSSENFGIPRHAGFEPLFHRCHLLIFIAASWFVQNALAGQIVQKPLDEYVIYKIPVACQSGNTTVLFPSAITGLYAKSVAVQEQPNADFLLSFTPGNFYFTVRALKKEAEDHLTVIYNRKAYVLQLAASEEPLYSVTFFRGGNTRAATRRVVPERLLSLLDKAKAYQLFQKDYPDALAGVVHAAPDATNYYDNFKVVTRDVWRFEEEDTLRVDIENTSDQTVYYKPQDLAVRLEDRIYTQSVADASGVTPPKSTTPAFFAITGNGSGGRNNLAPDNKWNVLVVRVDGQQREDGK